MASKTKQEIPIEAALSHKQMEEAIPKIVRRLSDLDVFDVNSINDRFDPKIGALENELETCLVSIFGANTIEYKRYHSDLTQLDTAPMSYVNDIPMNEVRDGFKRGISRAKTTLESIKKGFLEVLEDGGHSSGGMALKAYDSLELHPAIERAASQLFKDGHYANAIEDAVKALNALVRLNSGIDDKDGSGLMEFVFSPKNPILKFNALSDISDMDEQRGFMMMFSGAVAGLRNPRAHKIIKDDPEMALEFIAFISLLAKLADKSKK